MSYTYREPTEGELVQLQEAFNEYAAWGADFPLDPFPVVIVEGYESPDLYKGRVGVIIDGGGNAYTYGFNEDKAFLISDALNEKRGEEVF